MRRVQACLQLHDLFEATLNKLVSVSVQTNINIIKEKLALRGNCLGKHNLPEAAKGYFSSKYIESNFLCGVPGATA